MAKRITAIRTYRPELEREPTMQTDELVEKLTRHTTLGPGAVHHSMHELRAALLDAHRGGRAVKVDGLGTFTPTIRMNGELDIIFRPAPRLLRDLNDFTKLRANLRNKTSIGKSADDLIARWNSEHPDDPVE